MSALFNGVNLLDHLGAWRCAVYATDCGLLLQPLVQAHVDACMQHVKDGDTAPERWCDAWLRAFGAPMPQLLAEHLELRRAMHPKTKHIAKLLTSWFYNYQALKARPFTTYNTLAQRLQALAVTVPASQVQQLLKNRGSTPEVIQHMLLQQHVDLPVSAALTCLLTLTTTLPDAPAMPPAVAGSLTPPPVSWANVPVIKTVETEMGVPWLAAGSMYAVLCYCASTREASVLMVCETGETMRLAFTAPQNDTPVWISQFGSAPSSRQQLVVGCRQHIGVLSLDGSAIQWSHRDVLPASNHCEKIQHYIVWEHDSKLLAIHLQNTCLLEDEEEVHQLCVQHAQSNVAACKNVVYSTGVALFMLPPEFQQSIAAVYRPAPDVVDVFTPLGDWWRVHVPTLSANVVGLDVYPSTVVDACFIVNK